MALSYPDVLVSSVLEVMEGARAAIAAVQKGANDPWWRRILGRGRAKRRQQQAARAALNRAIMNLQTLKHLPNDRKIEWTRTVGTEDTVEALGSVRVLPVEVGAGGKSRSSESVTSTETVINSKEEYLERSLGEFRKLIKTAAAECDGGFVFLDEFYRVDRKDQPLVLGYMHRLVKDTGLWLKVGSVRYWTTPYRGGSPPQGMQPTQDANVISLDRGLQLLDSTRTFLETILGNIAARVKVDLGKLMTDGALARLVLASGGVPRDYLRLAGEAIKHARNRGPSAKAGSEKVMAEDVNSAAGQTAETKLEDLREDAPDEAHALERLLEDLAEFCRYNKAAYSWSTAATATSAPRWTNYKTCGSCTCSSTANPFPNSARDGIRCCCSMSPTSVSVVPSRLTSRAGRTDRSDGDGSSYIRTALGRGTRPKRGPKHGSRSHYLQRRRRPTQCPLPRCRCLRTATRRPTRRGSDLCRTGAAGVADPDS